MKVQIMTLVILLLLPMGLLMAQEMPDQPAVDSMTASLMPPAPPTEVTGRDKPNDHGHAVLLEWTLSADDQTGAASVMSYNIYRWTPSMFDSLRTIVNHKNDVWGKYKTRNLKEHLSSAVDSLKAVDDSLMLQIATLEVPAEGMEMVADSLKDLIVAHEAEISKNQTIIAHFNDLLGKEDLKGFLKDQYSLYVGLIDEVAAQLPAAYNAYPENGRWDSVGTVLTGANKYEHLGDVEKENSKYFPDNTDLYYKVSAQTIDPTVYSMSDVFGPIQTSGQWFNTGRLPVLIAVLIFAILTGIFVTYAKKGRDLYVRPLGGIEAVDDAIGRATEMGRPILYVLGLGTAADVATIASFTILGRVAKRVAEYQTELIVPTYDPIVMTVAQEVVKSAYFDAGRPDSYNEDTVYFVTQSQFAYVAAVNGTMLRELPATNVYMGKFFAESLLLAETGAVAGSIQISGTDEIAQIPFFIVACDYTLIGEELYAASAYLGKEPKLLGSLKAQDYAKALFVILAIIGIVCANLDWHWFPAMFEVTN